MYVDTLELTEMQERQHQQDLAYLRKCISLSSLSLYLPRLKSIDVAVYDKVMEKYLVVVENA